MTESDKKLFEELKNWTPERWHKALWGSDQEFKIQVDSTPFYVNSFESDCKKN